MLFLIPIIKNWTYGRYRNNFMLLWQISSGEFESWKKYLYLYYCYCVLAYKVARKKKIRDYSEQKYWLVFALERTGGINMRKLKRYIKILSGLCICVCFISCSAPEVGDNIHNTLEGISDIYNNKVVPGLDSYITKLNTEIVQENNMGE